MLWTLVETQFKREANTPRPDIVPSTGMKVRRAGNEARLQRYARGQSRLLLPLKMPRIMPRAEVVQQVLTLNAQGGFEGGGRIVNARVNDLAVARGGFRAHCGMSFYENCAGSLPQG